MTKPTIEVYFRHQLREIILQEIAENGPTCDLNHLDIKEMQDISDVFKGTNFNGNVSKWNLDMIRDSRGIFLDCPFSGDLSAWDVNPRTHIDGMLLPTFKGVLPAFQREPAEERTAAYITMFDGVDKYEQYLSGQPFGGLHAAFLVNTDVAPSWLSPEELAQARIALTLGSGLGLTHDALCAFVQEHHFAAKRGLDVESLSIDFSQ